MAPKRKNNNNHKKRKPKSTPHSSPSKSSNNSSPTIDRSTSTTPNYSNNSDPLSKSSVDPRSISSISKHTLPDTHTPPSINPLASNPKSDHCHSTETFLDPPARTAANIQPATDGKIDHTGSTADLKVDSKAEHRKASNNKPDSNNPLVDKNLTQLQRPKDRVLKEINDHNNPPKEPTSHHDTSDQAVPLKSLSGNPSKPPPNYHPSHPKKPIKQVKFTNNVKNEQSINTSTQENHPPEHNPPYQAKQEHEKKSGSKSRNITIRREMSGATDQFDFDAQQRQHAGPGGGMVKRPRHSQTNSTHSIGSNHSTSEEPEQVPPDSSPNGSRQEKNQRVNYTCKGYQHAQRCLQSMAQTQNFDPPTDQIDPDLLQIYLSYFDQNQDGLLDPVDTWKAIHRLGFGLVLATITTIILHAIMMPFVGMRSGLISKSLGLCHLPIGHHFVESTRNVFNITKTSLSRFVCVDHVDHHYPDKISPSILWKKTRENIGSNHIDPIGWLRFIFGWLIAITLTWPSDFTVKYDLIDGVFNGEILFLVAQDLTG